MENNTNEEEFFNESEIKKAGRHAEEMDTSFVEPKKHHFFAGFFIFLLIVLMGGACAYYFVLDTPKKTYLTLVNKVTEENSVVSDNKGKDINYIYSINANILSNDKSTQEVLDVINKIKLSGTVKYDDKVLTGSNNIKYKDGELLDIVYMLDLTKTTLYVKLNNILDKVIKLDVNNEKETVVKDVNKDDYVKLYNLLVKNFKLSLENANYKRKITKLNNNFVFQETLLLDETLEKEILTKLIHDDEFLQTYAKVKNTTVSEVSDELNEELADLDTEVSTISVYKTIIKNEIIKVELIDEDSNLVVVKEDNKYNFEIVEENELIYKGYLKEDKNNGETKEAFNLELIKEKLSIELNMTYTKNNNDNLKLDTEKAINYNEISEEDYNKITEYIKNNKTIKSLLDDLGLSEKMNEISSV